MRIMVGARGWRYLSLAYMCLLFFVLELLVIGQAGDPIPILVTAIASLLNGAFMWVFVIRGNSFNTDQSYDLVDVVPLAFMLIPAVLELALLIAGFAWWRLSGLAILAAILLTAPWRVSHGRHWRLAP